MDSVDFIFHEHNKFWLNVAIPEIISHYFLLQWILPQHTVHGFMAPPTEILDIKPIKIMQTSSGITLK